MPNLLQQPSGHSSVVRQKDHMRDNSMDDTPRIVGFGALTVNQIENVGGMKTGYSTSVLPTLYRSTESP